MVHKDKYRLIAIFAFITVVLLLVLLFIILWNNLSVNPEVQSGNVIYFLLMLLLIATGALFTGHLLQVHEHHADYPPEVPVGAAGTADSEEHKDKEEKEPPAHTYNIDIDQIAELIIPRKNPKEDIESFAEKMLSNLAKQFEAVLGVIYLREEKSKEFKPVSTFAWASERAPETFKAGEGLNGQAVKNKSNMKITDIPGGYIKITSGLGEGSPGNLMLVPLMLNKEPVGLIELAFFKEIDDETDWTFKNLARKISSSFVNRMKTTGEKK